MAHIHEKIDFTVAIFVVHERKILLIHHRKLGKWLPLGGHIELDEDEIASSTKSSCENHAAQFKNRCAKTKIAPRTLRLSIGSLAFRGAISKIAQ